MVQPQDTTNPETYEPSPFAPDNPIGGFEPERAKAVPGDAEVMRKLNVDVTLGPIDLPYEARTLIIDNPTGGWWYVPAAEQYVPPYMMNVVLRLKPTIQAHVMAQVPTGFASAGIAGQQGTARWLDIDLNPAPISPFGFSPLFQYKSGLYYNSFGVNNGTVLLVNNQARATTPQPISVPTRFDRIGINVTGAGDAGCLIALGLYRDVAGLNGGFPGALFLDAGQVPGDGVAFVERTINVVLPPGLWWPCALVTGAPVTAPTVTSYTAATSGHPFVGRLTPNTQLTGWSHAAVTAFPATFNDPAGGATGPLIQLRAA